jgi:deazaflavin-dependent oxidoreductase (nitroreductase family)
MAETPSEYNAKIITEFRASQGRVGGPWQDIPLLLLHHTGAQSATAHVNPVAYLRDGSRYFIWAANGGAPKHPAWYHNLKAHPNTKIEVGHETLNVVAEEMTGAERDRLLATATSRYPQLAQAAQKTDRLIPIVVLRPTPET